MKDSLLAAGILLMVGFGRQTAAQEPQDRGTKPVKVALVLEDQFERKQDIANHAGHIVVLLYGDRQGAPGTKQIGEKLHLHYHPDAKSLPPGQANKASVIPVADVPEGKQSPDVRVVPAVCLGKLGPALKTLVRNQVKRNAPDTPVWLDFDDRIKEQFGLSVGVPNLAVIDAAGNLRHHSAGEVDEKGIERLIGTIDQLRKETVANQK